MLFCRLDSLTPQLRQQRRQQQLQHLQLNPAAPPAIFQDAIAQASQQVQSELVWCSFAEYDHITFVPARGLEQLRNAQTLRSQGLAYGDSYAQYVIDAQQSLGIPDTAAHPVFAASPLLQQYGVRAYCGVPLITASDVCIGVMAIASLSPRPWTAQEIAGFEMIANWCLAAHERDCARGTITTLTSPETVMIQLLQELNQDLRKPLTTIMGMTRMLERQVYGQLSDKQAKYIGIVRQSGEQLLATVEEVVTLGQLVEQGQACQPSLTDIERLIQHVLNQLAPIVADCQHTVKLSMAPGQRLWLLDKQKISTALHHLLYCLLHNFVAGSQIYLHITEQQEAHLCLTLWATHPQLVDYATPTAPQARDRAALQAQILPTVQGWLEQYPHILDIVYTLQAQSGRNQPTVNPQEVCRLLLCCELLALHGGKLSWQITERYGYCYVVQVPQGKGVDTLA